jgi:hypothetical protein
MKSLEASRKSKKSRRDVLIYAQMAELLEKYTKDSLINPIAEALLSHMPGVYETLRNVLSQVQIGTERMSKALKCPANFNQTQWFLCCILEGYRRTFQLFHIIHRGCQCWDMAGSKKYAFIWTEICGVKPKGKDYSAKLYAQHLSLAFVYMFDRIQHLQSLSSSHLPAQEIKMPTSNSTPASTSTHPHMPTLTLTNLIHTLSPTPSSNTSSTASTSETPTNSEATSFRTKSTPPPKLQPKVIFSLNSSFCDRKLEKSSSTLSLSKYLMDRRHVFSSLCKRLCRLLCHIYYKHFAIIELLNCSETFFFFGRFVFYISLQLNSLQMPFDSLNDELVKILLEESDYSFQRRYGIAFAIDDRANSQKMSVVNLSSAKNQTKS